jgi:hypothetical protein
MGELEHKLIKFFIKAYESCKDVTRLFGIVSILFIFGSAISVILLIICYFEKDEDCFYPNDKEM